MLLLPDSSAACFSISRHSGPHALGTLARHPPITCNKVRPNDYVWLRWTGFAFQAPGTPQPLVKLPTTLNPSCLVTAPFSQAGAWFFMHRTWTRQSKSTAAHTTGCFYKNNASTKNNSKNKTKLRTVWHWPPELGRIWGLLDFCFALFCFSLESKAPERESWPRKQ